MPKMMMIDLETLDLRASAVILSAGVVISEMDTRENELERLFIIRPESQEDRSISASTVAWRMAQNKEAREIFNSTAQKHNLIGFLIALDNLFRECKVKYIWSKGADFDVKILEHAYTTTKIIRIPWTYKEVGCYRTIETLLGLAGGINIPAVLRRREDEMMYDALGDAKYQMRGLKYFFQTYNKN